MCQFTRIPMPRLKVSLFLLQNFPQWNFFHRKNFSHWNSSVKFFFSAWWGSDWSPPSPQTPQYHIAVIHGGFRWLVSNGLRDASLSDGRFVEISDGFTEIFSESGEFKPKQDYNYPFPFDLAPIGSAFGAKLIRKGYIQGLFFIICQFQPSVKFVTRDEFN